MGIVDFETERDLVVVAPPQTGISLPLFAAFVASTNRSLEGRSFCSLKVIHSAWKKRLLEKDDGRADEEVIIFICRVKENEGILNEVLMRLMRLLLLVKEGPANDDAV